MSYGAHGYGGSSTGLGSPSAVMATERGEMQALNDRLAGYLQRVKSLQAQGPNVDPAKYHEAMRLLEDELNKLKNLYEGELAKLRRQVDDANRDKNALISAADRNGAVANELQNKLQNEADNARKLQDALAGLEREKAGRDKELADLRMAVQAKDRELEAVRPEYTRMNRDGDELRRKLSDEERRRKESDDKVKQLTDKVTFDTRVADEQNRDLQNRLAAANDVIKSLENKIRQMTSSGKPDDEIQRTLQKMRDANAADMKRFQQETEDNTNRKLAALRGQMDEEGRDKERLARERNQMADAMRQLQAKNADLEAQNKAIKQHADELKGAIDQERARAQNQLRDLENRMRELQGHVMKDARENVGERAAQVTLRAEIETYKSLLDVAQLEQRGVVAPQYAPRPPSAQAPQTARPGLPNYGQTGSPDGAKRVSFESSYPAAKKEGLPNLGSRSMSSMGSGRPRNAWGITTYNASYGPRLGPLYSC